MKRICYFILALYLFNTGCIKKGDLDFKNVQVDNWTPDWALPLISSNLTLQSLAKSSDMISIDPTTGLYTLHYTAPLFSISAADYIKIPNQNFSTPAFTLNNPITSASFTGTISDSASNSSSFVDTNGALLNHVAIQSGNVQLQVFNTFNQNVSISVVFPNITKGGIPLSLSSSITYPSTSSTFNTSIAGYTIDLTNGGTTSNYMAYKLYYTLTGTGQPIAATNTISASMSFSNLNYTYIDGFLGHYSIRIPYDTIGVNIFNNNISANVFLLNPSVSLTFTNSFGLSVSADLDSVFGLTNKNQERNFTMPPIVLNGATSLGATAITDFTIDSANSSIQYIFNPGPNRLAYQGYLDFNPGVSSGYNFITDTSTISVSAVANLPADLKIITLALADTVKLSLPQDTSILQSADFKLLMVNGLPLYGTLQFNFTDSNYVVLDSLILPTNNVLQQAPVNASGIVTASTSAATEFIMQHDRYNKMASKVRYAIVEANLNTSGTSTVQILNTNYLNVKLACRFTLNVTQNSL